jgi:hypothetical protein
MEQPKPRRTGLIVAVLVILGLTAGAVIGLLIGWVVWPVSYVDTSLADLSPQDKEEYILLVAHVYQSDGDLEKAQTRLDQLGLPNVNQSLSALIDGSISEGRDEADIRALVALADGFGLFSPQMVAYLATNTPLPTDTPLPSPTPLPTETPTMTPIPPTDTAVPTEIPATDTPLPQPTATPLSPTATPVPPTATPQPQPTNTPRPTSPPAPTNTPQPTKAPVAQWTSSARLVGPGEDAQRCDAGSQQIRVTVVDANGSPLSGVWIYEQYSGLYQVSGHKVGDPYWGPGDVEIPCPGFQGGGVVCITDGPGGSCISAQTRGMSCYAAPPVEDLFAAGYCENCCKVGVNLDECRQLINEGKCMGNGHYSWRVVFKRSW